MTGISLVERAFWAEVERVIYLHTTPWELDEALVDWGYGLGPCEAMDLTGLDRVLAAHGTSPTPVLARMVADGRLGKRAGWGFYRYPGGGGAVADPLIEDLVREEAWFAGQERSELEGQALVDALHGQVRDVLCGPDARDVHFPMGRQKDL